MLAVRIAHAHRHFKRQLAVAVLGQAGGHGVQRDPFEQHVLHQPGHIERCRFSGQGFGDAANFLAFGVGFMAVGEGGKQGDTQQGFLLVKCHGEHFFLSEQTANAGQAKKTFFDSAGIADLFDTVGPGQFNSTHWPGA